MTIAIGILASNGIVLAADTEISTDGEIKGVDTKLVAATTQVYGKPAGQSIGVAGAGSWGYFQSVKLDVTKIVLSNLFDDPESNEHVKQRLGQFIGEFYQKHVIAFHKLKNPPDLQLLIGTWAYGKGLLWGTDKMVSYPSFDFDAIGVGGTYARSLLHGYYTPMPVDSAAMLAIYAVARVKAAVAGCGQETQILVVRDNMAKSLPRDLILRGEAMFSEQFIRAQSRVMHFVLGIKNDPSAVEFEPIRDECDRLRQDIRDTIS